MKYFNKNLVIELFALSSAILALNHFIFPGAILSFTPNPLWLIVILASMRHGAPDGFFAGCVAAGLHLWNLTSAGYSLQELLNLNPETLVTPVLFILVGIYLGETIENIGKRGEHFKEQVDELNRQLEANEIKRLNLERGLIELQKRVAGQTDTLLTVYENFNRLNDARSESEVWTILTDIARRELRAEACGVWRA
ncbi:MAG: hypothetical protein FWG74_06890, partial [Planctomycetes bacterium]|nr:hypothetical protein [Planctomycetota bacterium]